MWNCDRTYAYLFGPVCGLVGSDFRPKSRNSNPESVCEMDSVVFLVESGLRNIECGIPASLACGAFSHQPRLVHYFWERQVLNNSGHFPRVGASRGSAPPVPAPPKVGVELESFVDSSNMDLKASSAREKQEVGSTHRSSVG